MKLLINEFAENNTCSGGSKCNCDSDDAKWLSDESTFTSAESLGITEMFFMQQPNLDASSQGRMTLGPLECVEASKFFPSLLFSEFSL